MRTIETQRRWFVKELDGQYRPADDQPAASELMDIELSLYLLETVAPDQAATGAPALLDGYRRLWDVTGTVPDDASVRMANARILLWRRMQRPFRWDRLIYAYLSVPEHIRGYNLDGHGRARRRACRVAPDRWSVYETLLTQPLLFAKAPVRLAGPGRYRMSSTARGHGVEIPDGLPEFATARKHNLDVRSRRGIRVTWKELLATAQEMDATDRILGRSNDWEGRLREVTLQIRDADDAFRDADTFTIDTMLHVLGIVSVGKTTLVSVLSVWAAQHGNTVTIVVGDNSAALRTTAKDLAVYRGVRVAPVLGVNRARHTERLHRLQPAPAGRLTPPVPFGFELVSTACALGALRDTAKPLQVREAPCEHLVAHDPDAAADSWREKPKHTCPAWHGCQRNEASRQLVDANIWVATPWGLVHTKVPTQLGGTQLRYLEAAWRRSDLIIVDEADQVQANLDEMFANAQVLLGSSEEAWIDEIGARLAERLRSEGRAPTTSMQVRRFTNAVNHARTAAELIYQMLQRDRRRAGRPLLNWIDRDYFTAWALCDQLARQWAGYSASEGRRPLEGWEDDPLYRLLRDSFNTFIDDPTGATQSLAAELAGLATAQLSDTEEDSREQRIRQWLTSLADRELVPGRKITQTGPDADVWRLELALAVAVMAHRLNLMLAMWPQAAAELGMSDTLTAELRRPPTDLTAVVPEAPMGNVLGFQYVEDDDPYGRTDGQLGEFRFFRYSGVGRMLLINMPNLFPADGPGPNVLLLSGTSWAGTSPRYHIDVPVGAILRPSADKLAQIAKTTFALDIQYSGERRWPICVSGRYGPARTLALQQMVQELTRPGPGGLNRLERERDQLPARRQKILLLVGSYAEARAVTESLMKAKSSWKGQIRCLIGDDELDSGWDDPHHLRRYAVAEFGTDSAWLLVAPILAVERGHNILNEDGVAAIGAAFFLVRPHPRPRDLGYVTQRINQYAQAQMRPHTVGDGEPHLRLAVAGDDRRRAAQRQWRRLLHTLVAYSRLDDDERRRVAWTQLVTIWQVVGRLLRGGQAARVYFCDAAFAPITAQSIENELDDATTSLLVGMREVLTPYFEPDSGDPDRHLVRALYEPLHHALSAMGDS